MRRTFILHASGAKLPTDLLGLTCVRYADTLTIRDENRQPENSQRNRERTSR
ncbi:MAG: nucleotide-binding protein, partial [Pseudolabrys sp.]